MSGHKFHELYFPGLISLAFLPLLCIIYFLENNAFHKYRVMDIAIAPKELINKWISSPHKKGNIETYRKYEVLTLTGDLTHDNRELNKLKALIKQLTLKKDTINGIKVMLGRYTKYEEFVGALDILFQNEDQNFGFDPIGNEIFIFQIAQPPQSLTSQRYYKI